jgi:hypothetical protein
MGEFAVHLGVGGPKAEALGILLCYLLGARD